MLRPHHIGSSRALHCRRVVCVQRWAQQCRPQPLYVVPLLDVVPAAQQAAQPTPHSLRPLKHACSAHRPHSAIADGPERAREQLLQLFSLSSDRSSILSDPNRATCSSCGWCAPPESTISRATPAAAGPTRESRRHHRPRLRCDAGILQSQSVPAQQRHATSS